MPVRQRKRHKLKPSLLWILWHRKVTFMTHFYTVLWRLVSITWDVTKVPVDAEVGVGGDDATLEDLLTDHRGERVFGCMNVGLDQPWVLWTFWGGTVRKCILDNYHTCFALFCSLMSSVLIYNVENYLADTVSVSDIVQDSSGTIIKLVNHINSGSCQKVNGCIHIYCRYIIQN